MVLRIQGFTRLKFGVSTRHISLDCSFSLIHKFLAWLVRFKPSFCLFFFSSERNDFDNIVLCCFPSCRNFILSTYKDFTFGTNKSWSERTQKIVVLSREIELSIYSSPELFAFLKSLLRRNRQKILRILPSWFPYSLYLAAIYQWRGVFSDSIWRSENSSI